MRQPDDGFIYLFAGVPPTPAKQKSDKVLPFRPAVRPQQSAVAPSAPHRDLPAWSPDLLSAVATATGLPASAGRWGTTRTGVNLGIAALAAVLRNMSGPASRDEVERAVVLSILPALLQAKFDAKTAPKWRRVIGKANMSLTSIAALSISWAEVVHRARIDRLLEIDADEHWLAGADINDVPTGELDARALVALSWLASVSGASVEDAEDIAASLSHTSTATTKAYYLHNAVDPGANVELGEVEA